VAVRAYGNVKSAVAETSYGARLHHIAAADPEGVALIFAADDGRESRHSWSELDDRSTQLARVLQRTGVGRGDRVAVQLRNSPEFVIGCFAAWKLGATVIPTRWDLPDWELQRVRSVIAAAAELRPETSDLFETARLDSAEPFEFPVSPIAHGICSSGATGTPKVILRRTRAVWPDDARSTTIPEQFGILETPAQRTLVCGPMYHTNGFTGIADLLSGYTVIILGRFRAERAVDLIERHSPTGLVAATPLLQRIAQVPGVTGRNFTSLQWVLQGAALLPMWVAQTWFELVGPKRMVLLYGSTEAAGTVAIRGDEYLLHPGSLGKGFMGTRIKILRPNNDEAEPDEIGEIYTRPGDGVFVHEYLGDVPQTPVTPDGFTTIGDLGWLDEQGYLYLADRRVDLIKTGGANVFPAEVEVALSEHPDIGDVVVIGLPDPEWGKRVHAVVQPVDTAAPLSAEDVIAYAKARLAPYKVPKSVEFVARLPRSEAGKLSRGAMIRERCPDDETISDVAG
jgi:bile acid-coenzyme A ligase